MFIFRKSIIVCSVIAFTALGGCSSNKHEQSNVHTVNPSMEPIKVELNWSPDQVTVNQKVVFEAVVTQGNESVDDAKEVLFEIVNQEDANQKIEIKGESVGNGVYTAEGVLIKEGVYNVTSHVTARTQHSMPTKELAVAP